MAAEKKTRQVRNIHGIKSTVDTEPVSTNFICSIRNTYEYMVPITDRRFVSEKDIFTNPEIWMILLTVNDAFFDMFENWWWYFSKLGLSLNVTVIAEDDFVFETLKEKYAGPSVEIVRSWIINISSSLDFGTTGYRKMMTARPEYILKYLNDSVNILYTDTDSVFLQSPFKYFTGIFDMWAESEFKGKNLCAGFTAIRSSSRTIKFVKTWIKRLSISLQTNQPAFNEEIKSSNVTFACLNERLFVGGPTFSKMSNKERSKVVLVHATFCETHKGKYDCFKNWNLWRSNVSDSTNIHNLSYLSIMLNIQIFVIFTLY